jgi:hypothetical protein
MSFIVVFPKSKNLKLYIFYFWMADGDVLYLTPRWPFLFGLQRLSSSGTRHHHSEVKDYERNGSSKFQFLF